MLTTFKEPILIDEMQDLNLGVFRDGERISKFKVSKE